MILVKGGYTPDTIIVRSGRPVRLNFRREETASCSDKVIFADFQKSADLPTGQTVAVELLAQGARRIRVCVPDGHVPRTPDRRIGELRMSLHDHSGHQDEPQRSFLTSPAGLVLHRVSRSLPARSCLPSTAPMSSEYSFGCRCSLARSCTCSCTAGMGTWRPRGAASHDPQNRARERHEHRNACLWPVEPRHRQLVVFILFAYSFFKPRTRRDWRSFGAFSAFLVALFAEMYGFPLTIYFLSGWLQSRYPGIDWFSHDAGHLLEMMFGWKTNPHFGPFHVLSFVFIGGGFIADFRGLDACSTMRSSDGRSRRPVPTATSGIRSMSAFILVMFGFLLQWPTMLTLAMFPVLV